MPFLVTDARPALASVQDRGAVRKVVIMMSQPA
jgi:hypothetical protein